MKIYNYKGLNNKVEFLLRLNKRLLIWNRGAELRGVNGDQPQESAIAKAILSQTRLEEERRDLFWSYSTVPYAAS